MRPLIAITPSEQNNNREYKLNKPYVNAIFAAGGVPAMLGINSDYSVISTYLDRVDGLLLSGGLDIAPENYRRAVEPGLGETNPERDQFEIELFMEAVKRKIPVLGICRGFQLINVAEGGTMIQDINQYKDRYLPHSQKCSRTEKTHSVRLKKGSIIQKISKSMEISVNSIHHQVIDQVAADYRVTAVSTDGVIEVIERKKDSLVIGIQWHPEELYSDNKEAMAIFEYLVAESRNYYLNKHDFNIGHGGIK